MILVTGGTGQVGSALLNLLKLNNISCDAPGREILNLDHPENIVNYLQDKKYSALVHLAAETNVDFCETNQEIALTRNYLATCALANYAKENRIPIIFVSSSAVLSGDGKFMHSEDSSFSPSNFYGKTKMLAEEFIAEHCEEYLTIRASWMLGRGSHVKKFAEIAYEKISLGEPFAAVYDKFGSLTSANGLAQLIFTALSKPTAQTIHYSSNTPCSRYDVAKYIKNAIGSQSVIEPVESSKFILPAPRGFSEGLKGDRAFSIFGASHRTWEEELEKFLEEL